MKIALGTQVILYTHRDPLDPRSQIVVVSREYHWMGNGNVGCWEDDGTQRVVMNVNEVEHITHVVPAHLRNPNHGFPLQRKGGLGSGFRTTNQYDLDVFVEGYDWKDFEKGSIETEYQTEEYRQLEKEYDEADRVFREELFNHDKHNSFEKAWSATAPIRKKLWDIGSRMRLIQVAEEFRPLPHYGDHMTLERFVSDVNNSLYILPMMVRGITQRHTR